MKKKLLALCLATGLMLSVIAQEKVKDKDVPASVQTTFKTQYPEASDADWKMKDGKYKAHFKVSGTKHMAAFDPSGTLLSTGIEIKESELPAAITAAIKSTYVDRSIDDAYKVDKDGSINYLVTLNGNPETKILYSADGKVMEDK